MSSRLGKDVNYQEEKTYRIVHIKGKHGDIMLSVPNQKPTEDEWNKFNEDMTKIIYSKVK